MKHAPSLLALALISAFFSTASLGQFANTPWPMFHHDARQIYYREARCFS